METLVTMVKPLADYMRPTKTQSASESANSALQFTGATGLHKGDRPYQQDQVLLIPHHRQKDCFLGLIADGMGGKTGGRTASNQVLQTATQLFITFDPLKDDPDEFLQRVGQEAHTIIHLTSFTSEEEPHTTFAAFLVLPNGHAHIAHCGDSRVYFFEKQKLIYRTQDHSYVQALINAGKLTEEEARFHPKSNLITSCLGVFLEQGPTISQYQSRPLKKGDFLLACSDGLWGFLSAKEIASTLNFLPPQKAAEELVKTAFERSNGHSDNISIVIVGIR